MKTIIAILPWAKTKKKKKHEKRKTAEQNNSIQIKSIHTKTKHRKTATIVVNKLHKQSEQ